MGIIRGLIIPVVILAGGVAAFLALAASKTPPKRREVRTEAPLVEVTRASSGASDGFTITVNGTVIPRRVFRLAAEVEGRIVEKSDRCEPGYSVRKGDLLLRIDPKELELRQQTLDADRAQVRADLAGLEVEITNNRNLIALAERDLDLQQRERQRVVMLAQRNSSSQAELEAADRKVLEAQRALQSLQNERNTFDARRDRLEAQRAGAEAQLDQVRYDLERTEVRSPVDGVIVEAPVERNGYVRPGDELAMVEDTSTLEVHCNLQMDDLYWLAKSTPPTGSPGEWMPGEASYRIPEAPATIRYRLSGETVTWEGRLARYEGGGIDERTRTVPCRVAIPASEILDDHGPLSLRRGMFVEVTLQAGASSVPLLSVPRQGLRPNGEVWVARDGTLRIVGVDVVRMLDDRVILRAGDNNDTSALKPDDALIVSPLSTPIDGMAVRIMDDSNKPPSSDANTNSAATAPETGSLVVPASREVGDR